MNGWPTDDVTLLNIKQPTKNISNVTFRTYYTITILHYNRTNTIIDNAMKIIIYINGLGIRVFKIGL